MATQIQIRRDTAGNWYGNNTVLSVGEFGYETDTKRIKIGDGASFYNNLHYVHDPTAPTQERLDNPIYLHKIEVDDNKVQINDAGSNANVDIQIDGSSELNVSADGLKLFQGEKVNAILDEDDMSTNSSTALATQQSIKTYVDALPGSTNVGELLDVTTAGATTGQVLKYNGASWQPMDDTDTTLILSGESIGSMGDVSLTEPSPIADGHILKWNSSQSKFEPAAEFFLNLINDDNFQTGVSATSVASSLSIKNYVDTQVLANIPDSDLIDDDTMGTATATSISSSESIKAYVDNTVGGLTLGATTLGALTDVDVTGAATNKILKYNGSNWIVADDTDTTLTLLDEDDFASDSDTQAPTQQSVKAYVDANSGGGGAGGSGLNQPWIIHTDDSSTFVTTAGMRILVDTSTASGDMEIDLPDTTSLSLGAEIIITFATDGGSGFIVNVYPSQVSNDNIDGQTVSQISPNLYGTVHLVYKDATDGWISLYHDGTSLPYT